MNVSVRSRCCAGVEGHARWFRRVLGSSLALITVVVMTPAWSADTCDLRGKSFTYRFLWNCTETDSEIHCLRSYEKMTVIGDTVLVYDAVEDSDHYEPSGQIYYLNKKVEVSGDQLQERDEVESVNSGFKATVFVSAAITHGVIRTAWEQLMALKSGGPVRMRVLDLRTLAVSPDCSSCQLLEHSMVTSGVGSYGKMELKQSLSCVVGSIAR